MIYLKFQQNPNLVHQMKSIGMYEFETLNLCKYDWIKINVRFDNKITFYIIF